MFVDLVGFNNFDVRKQIGGVVGGVCDALSNGALGNYQDSCPNFHATFFIFLSIFRLSTGLSVVLLTEF